MTAREKDREREKEREERLWRRLEDWEIPINEYCLVWAFFDP